MARPKSNALENSIYLYSRLRKPAVTHISGGVSSSFLVLLVGKWLWQLIDYQNNYNWLCLSSKY